MSEENAVIAKNVGMMIAKYRKQAGLSQAKVAELLDLSIDSISRIERGNIVPNVPRLFEFDELLAQLNTKDRAKLLNFVEAIVEWKQEK
ncbi:TPA: helix-turn-helix domain-containing protein [Haemophilus influenzae]